jgi:hypothetical protein
MLKIISDWLRSFWRFFPVQLLVVSLRKHQALLLFWIFIFTVVVGRFAANYGVPYLFLDPEYLGNVGYLSFAFVGMGFAALFVTWNIVSYMLHSHRFEFLASLEKPLSVFFINNSIIPAIFLTGYIWAIIRFQSQFEFQNWKIVGLILAGFFAGFVFILLLTSVYFQLTNRTVQTVAKAYKMELRTKKMIERMQKNEELEPDAKWRVDSFISTTLFIRHTRSVEHYEDVLSKLVFRQHHINSLFVQIATIALLIGLGFYVENPFFQIPTAASVFLVGSILTSLIGVFIYWTGGWGTTAIVVFVIVVNQLTKYDFFGYQSRAFGLVYDGPQASYTLDSLRSMSSEKNIADDKKYFLQILNNWKQKNIQAGHEKKPKMLFLNSSGGGLRSSAFTMAVFQKADSILNGSLMKKTFLMSGASGGAVAFAYLHELNYRQSTGGAFNLWDRNFYDRLSLDLLNPMGISILSNDLFFPIHKFKIGNQTYFRDRGYIFEKYLALNTGMDFEKKLSDYRAAEFNAQIPLLIFHTAIINDSRKFYMSAHPVRFLMRPYSKRSHTLDLSIDGIDFCNLFKQQQGYELRLLSAARMNASFPFILPQTILPSEPPAYVFDAGAIDNFGIETTIKFLTVFKDWINENTSGVVILQTRDSQKEEEPQETRQKTFLQSVSQPLGSFYNNLENIQDYHNDTKLGFVNDLLKGKIQFILFEYIPEKKTEKASMSLRLTSREKREILNSLSRPNNTRSFELMRKALGEKM